MAARETLSTERVVEAAAELADREGLPAVTLARLAGDLGVQAPSLYKHVDGLDDLHRRLRIRAIEVLGDALADACVGQAGEAAVHALASAYRDFSRSHPGLLPLVVPATETGDEATRAAGRRVVDVVVRALSAYQLDETAALHATRVLRSTLHGFATLERSGGFGRADLDLDLTFSWLVEMLTGALADPPQWTRAGASGRPPLQGSQA